MKAVRILTLCAVAGVAAAALAIPSVAEPDPAVVQTSHGAVRGEVTDDGRLFEGIPYAAPPTGERRWRSPQPARAWTGVRDATEPGEPCPQQAQSENGPTVIGDEDCLFLNVRTPRTSASRVRCWCSCTVAATPAATASPTTRRGSSTGATPSW